MAVVLSVKTVVPRAAARRELGIMNYGLRIEEYFRTTSESNHKFKLVFFQHSKV